MKKKKIFWTAVIVTFCVVSGLIYLKMDSGQEVETVVVEKGELQQYVEDTAVVQTNKK